MDPHLAIPLIERCPPLASIAREPKHRLARICREVRFKAGERIFSIAHPADRVLIVLDGLAKLVGITEDGVERILYVYQPCEILGSRLLLKDSPESPYEVVAMEDLHALAISKADFMTVTQEYPEVMEAVTRVLLERIDDLAEWMLVAMSLEASLRLAKVLLSFADTDAKAENGFVPLKYSPTHETISQIIGASRPHTTTLLRELEEEGAVRRLKPRGLLVCPARLERELREAGMERHRETD